MISLDQRRHFLFLIRSVVVLLSPWIVVATWCYIQNPLHFIFTPSEKTIPNTVTITSNNVTRKIITPSSKITLSCHQIASLFHLNPVSIHETVFQSCWDIKKESQEFIIRAEQSMIDLRNNEVVLPNATITLNYQNHPLISTLSELTIHLDDGSITGAHGAIYE